MTKFILQFTTGEKFSITQDEAEKIAQASDNQSITIKRLGMVIQKRMVQIYPQNHPDILEDRKKQQIGILHDGTKAKRHFGQWVCFNEMPDDKGNYSPVRLDTEYYPEVALDMVATPEEYKKIKETGINYYKYFNIEDKIKRINNKKGFTHLLE